MESAKHIFTSPRLYFVVFFYNFIVKYGILQWKKQQQMFLFLLSTASIWDYSLPDMHIDINNSLSYMHWPTWLTTFHCRYVGELFGFSLVPTVFSSGTEGKRTALLLMSLVFKLADFVRVLMKLSWGSLSKVEQRAQDGDGIYYTGGCRNPFQWKNLSWWQDKFAGLKEKYAKMIKTNFCKDDFYILRISFVFTS